MPRVNVLRNLKIREVSSVDRGAGKGVKVMLYKRAGGPALEADAEAYLKREFTPDRRKELAASGAAMKDGSYPIENEGDLKNAIRAIGRAKNPGKARSHIVSRARALGKTDLLPDGWVNKAAHRALISTAKRMGQVRRLLKDAASFDEVLDEMGSTSFADGVIECIRDAYHAVKESIESIAECDDLDPAEKADAITESLGQFLDHLAGIAPGNIVKAHRGALPMASLKKQLQKAFQSVPAHNATPPTTDKDVKIDNDADKNVKVTPDVKTADANANKRARKDLEKAIDGLEGRVKLWKGRAQAAIGLEKAAKDYLDHNDNDMDDEDKMKFLDMSPEKRAKFMEARPLAQMTQKRIDSLPEPVRKELEAGKAAAVQVAKLAESNELVEFSKRAIALGQPEAFGAHLRTVSKRLGTEEEFNKAWEEVQKTLEAYANQAKTAGLFKEFGTARGATGNAYDQLIAKRDELLANVAKTANGKPMTVEQAFAKVYEDPTNAELVAQYKQEIRRAA